MDCHQKLSVGVWNSRPNHKLRARTASQALFSIHRTVRSPSHCTVPRPVPPQPPSPPVCERVPLINSENTFINFFTMGIISYNVFMDFHQNRTNYNKNRQHHTKTHMRWKNNKETIKTASTAAIPNMFILAFDFVSEINLPINNTFLWSHKYRWVLLSSRFHNVSFYFF